MLIFELFNKTVKWEYETNISDEVNASFVIGENLYIVSMTEQEDLELFDPDETFDNFWHVDFEVDSAGQGLTHSATGTGNAFTVFSTVLNIINIAIKEHNITSLYFTASRDEPSRIKLYNSMAKQFMKKGWRYIDNDEIEERGDEDDWDAGGMFEDESNAYVLTRQQAAK